MHTHTTVYVQVHDLMEEPELQRRRQSIHDACKNAARDKGKSFYQQELQKGRDRRKGELTADEITKLARRTRMELAHSGRPNGPP